MRKFSKISDVPTEEQVSEDFSCFDIIQYYTMVNFLLRRYFKPHKIICDEYISYIDRLVIEELLY